MAELSEEFEYFTYLIECYAERKNMTAWNVLQEWEKHDIVAKIFKNYWIYHTESMENAFRDIDSLLATGKYAW